MLVYAPCPAGWCSSDTVRRSGPRLGNTPGAPIFRSFPRAVNRQKPRACSSASSVRPRSDRCSPAHWCRAEETCTLAGFVGQPDPDLVEWDYGDYEGLTTPEIREFRPGWTIWDDGVPDGETAADVGRRADRVIQRARELDSDTLCVAHGHILRVLTARWLGLPPVAGRLFLLRTGAVCVLGWDLDWPAIEAWNIRG